MQSSVDPEARPEKRQRLEDADAGCDNADPTEGASGPPPSDQLKQALHKIANHISNSAKFPKASQLLRQVMDAVDKSHSNDFFIAVKEAFTHPEHCIDPLLRKDYVRLMKAVNLRSDVFSKQQRAELEVFSVLALTQNELFTDDSFAFNKVIAKIKAAVAQLPEADVEQEAAWVQLFPEEAAALGITAAQHTTVPGVASQQQQEARQQQQRQQQQQATVDKEEADPFGLDAFLAKAAEEEAAAAAAAAQHTSAQPADSAGNVGHTSAASDAGGTDPSLGQAAAEGPAAARQKSTWDPVSCLVMHKQALLSCVNTAKSHQHKLAWARTSIEILIEEVAKPTAQGGLAGKFVGGQKQQLQELLKFVHSERAARKSGVSRRPGGKGTGEYMTSFEKARAEWGSASWVSARGKVGGQGDAKQQNWLG